MRVVNGNMFIKALKNKGKFSKMFSTRLHFISPESKVDTDEQKLQKLFIQYRRQILKKFEQSLKRIDDPCKGKSFTITPNAIDKPLRSGVVYKIVCPRCKCRANNTSFTNLSKRAFQIIKCHG